jgi:hypothetical protein
VTLLDNVLHAPGGDEASAPVVDLTYTATDSDGDIATGTLAITFNDDAPSAFVPTTAVLDNAASPVSAPIALNFDAVAGADDVGDVVFNLTDGTPLVDTDGKALKLAGEALFLQNVAGSDGHVIEARTADGDLAFTATLNPGGDSYTIDLDGAIYNVEQFSFTNVTGTVGGGNVNYKGLGVGNGGSQDILISGNGSVNTNASEIGIASGNDIGSGDLIRFDMVSNLAVTAVAPSNGNTGFTHAGHYEVGTYVQAISFVQGGGTNTAGFTVTILNGDSDFSYLGDGTGETAPPDIKVEVYDGDPNTGGTLVDTFTDTDNDVVVTGVREGYYIKVTSTDPFSIVEYSDQTGRPFKLGAIQIETANTLDSFDFVLPITATDSDGDSVNSNIQIHLDPVVPPIVLDLDGDGAEFLSLSAGVAFDYLGDGQAEATAWVGADDGLLAIDRNGDGLVNDGSEIVFGRDGLTDLEGLAADYDSNADGVFDAQDAAFAQFGVWQDANSNGVADAGEFRSLAEAGITGISLTSDGQAYAAAGGDVQVFGTGTYTWADGTTGSLADVSFATGAPQRQSAELLAASSAATGLLAAMAMDHAAAQAMPALQAASARTTDLPARAVSASAPAGQAADQADAQTANGADKAGAPVSSGSHSSQADAGHNPIDLAGGEDHATSQAASNGAGEKSALFDFNDVSHSVMGELLAVGGPVAASQGASHALPALAEALADTLGNHAVDGIVEYFAGNDTGGSEIASKLGDFAYQGLLDSSIEGAGSDAGAPQFNLMTVFDHDQAAALS